MLWLWRRPVATAPIGPLAWEPPYAAGAAQETAKRQKKKKKKKERKKRKERKKKKLFVNDSPCLGGETLGCCVLVLEDQRSSEGHTFVSIPSLTDQPLLLTGGK